MIGNDPATAGISAKQREFNEAMARYSAGRGYQLFGLGVSLANVGLQTWLLWRLQQHSIGVWSQLISLVIAWLITDFINGLVHLYMDNNDRYDGFTGPLTANFHLHHKKPLYTRRNLALVYFIESGSKVWLVPCLALLAAAEAATDMNPLLLHTLVYSGILSSCAEVSHYLCHTSTAAVPVFLGRCRILLGKKHHGIHHLQDNRNYAFLNGLTDPLLNAVAARWGHGYKEHTDRHYEAYELEGESR